MKPLCELCDWVNVMNYDYYSYLDGESGPNAPYHGTASKFGVVSSQLPIVRHFTEQELTGLVLG